MRNPRPLTEQAQTAVAAVLKQGGRAIDATMGNGHDTLFMAHRVAPGGKVIAFDIQEQALQKTREKLIAAHLEPVVELHRCGHEQMGSRVPPDWAGRVAAVMFNLGYLPGGDKRLITRAATTCSALEQALALLQAGGLLSLMLYRGHAGADQESAAVQDWIDGLGHAYRVNRLESPGPLLFLIERLHRA